MLLNIEAIKGESFHMDTDCPCHGRVVEPGTAVVPQVVNAPRWLRHIHQGHRRQLWTNKVETTSAPLALPMHRTHTITPRTFSSLRGRCQLRIWVTSKAIGTDSNQQRHREHRLTHHFLRKQQYILHDKLTWRPRRANEQVVALVSEPRRSMALDNHLRPQQDAQSIRMVITTFLVRSKRQVIPLVCDHRSRRSGHHFRMIMRHVHAEANRLAVRPHLQTEPLLATPIRM